MKYYIRKRCYRCNGNSEVECSSCGGSGYSWSGGQCSYCYGEGTVTCPECNGDGYIEEESDENEGW